MPALARMLERDVKEGRLKPALRIHASMESSSLEDGKFDESRAKDLRAEIAAIQKELKNWDAEEVAARAEKELRSELEVKKAQLAESEARAKKNGGSKAAAAEEGDDEENDDEADEKDEEDEEDEG